MKKTKSALYSPVLHVWLLLLRMGVTALMLTHGLPKLMRVIDGNFKFSDPLGLGSTPSLILAVFAEVGCSILVLLGLRTKWAVVPLIITMLVAALIAHANDPFGKKELPLLYILVYVTLFFLGSGKYSLDARMGNS